VITGEAQAEKAKKELVEANLHFVVSMRRPVPNDPHPRALASTSQ
jgi:DNA-directed RNA polymerase sigma subunit (sigma70/sigma32)